jgi:signal transduction histidine kinase
MSRLSSDPASTSSASATSAPQGATPSPDPAPDAAGESWLPTRLRSPRWLGWRLRAVVVAAILGCVCIFLLASTLAQQPRIDAHWRADAQGRVELVTSADPALGAMLGRTLVAVHARGIDVTGLDAWALERSPRWLSTDALRTRYLQVQERLAAALATGHVQLEFANGEQSQGEVLVKPAPGGLSSLNLLFVLLSVLALAVYLAAMVVFTARPTVRNLLYLVMALAQAGNLLIIASASTFDLVVPAGFASLELHARTVLDLVTAAAVLHSACVHPRRLPGAQWVALAGWTLVAFITWLLVRDALVDAWWWTQAGCIGLGLGALALLSWSYRIRPHPFAIVLRRFGAVSVSAMALLTIAVAAASTSPLVQQQIASVGATIWVVFLSCLLLLAPFLSRSKQVLREFALLAAISTIASSLDLLFVALFSLSQTASLALSSFLALGIYAGARQTLLNQLRGSGMVTMERLFERLYRVAREVEQQPQRSCDALLSLLRELFEPMEATVAPHPSTRSRVVGEGSTLLVPVPDLRRASGQSEQTLMLRFSHHGRRLFTAEDARLTDRIVEQLRRAVAFDRAVERGRTEERARLAQDLHDDIGARLLTLMYQAQDPQQEDYIRHTLQDLKTLTRGLAAHSHRLSHAAAEWKADVQQRLQVAHCELSWQAGFDQDVPLSVGQWSALTRVLRELVSNAIAHSGATRVEIALHLDADCLSLSVRDNGCGRNPQNWAQGLGLGGVRKRVRQLGGEVIWREDIPSGIECRVRFPRWSQRA